MSALVLLAEAGRGRYQCAVAEAGAGPVLARRLYFLRASDINEHATMIALEVVIELKKSLRH